jgi:hypothetical protein
MRADAWAYVKFKPGLKQSDREARPEIRIIFYSPCAEMAQKTFLDMLFFKRGSQACVGLQKNLRDCQVVGAAPRLVPG